MQFIEALNHDERKHIARFVTSDEQEHALSDEFQIVSLVRTLALGGYLAKHRKIETKKPKAKKEPEPTAIADNSLESLIQRRYESMFIRPVFWGVDEAREETNPITDWSVPKLALCPARKDRVTLTSSAAGYSFAAGKKWSLAFKPSWHTAFPGRGTLGLNRYESNYSAQTPPLPREAQKAVEDFGADKSLVLWEADWEEKEQYLDPAILVPVWRDLYSVVYTWDLTDAERAALKKASANR
jgi:hypothetical protein